MNFTAKKIFKQILKVPRDNSSEVTLRYGMNSITFEFPARFVRRYLKRDLVWGNESLEVASDNDRDATYKEIWFGVASRYK